MSLWFFLCGFPLQSTAERRPNGAPHPERRPSLLWGRCGLCGVCGAGRLGVGSIGVLCGGNGCDGVLSLSGVGALPDRNLGVGSIGVLCGGNGCDGVLSLSAPEP